MSRFGDLMMSLSPAKTSMPAPEEALPGRSEPAFEVPERNVVLDTPMKPPFPDGIETAYFALGCFWGAERLFWELDGVYTTAAGYMGGMTPNPTYDEVCSGRPVTPRRSWSPTTPRRSPTPTCSRSSSRSTTRPRACARATTSGPSTAPASTSPTTTRSRPRKWR